MVLLVLILKLMKFIKNLILNLSIGYLKNRVINHLQRITFNKIKN